MAGQGQSYDAVARRSDELDILHRGESKVVKQIDDSYCLVTLLPTLYSHTANRTSEVLGTENLRLRASRVLWNVLEERDIPTSIVHVGRDYYVSEIVEAPPIEVIVKAALVGTPKHVCAGISNYPTRNGSVLNAFAKHEPYVRFDWRNPLPQRDECLPTSLADYFIDTTAAEAMALRAFRALTDYLEPLGLDLLDICFFIDVSGSKIFGEISPDCMRLKLRGEDMDKDLWRKGEAPATLLSNWIALAESSWSPRLPQVRT